MTRSRTGLILDVPPGQRGNWAGPARPCLCVAYPYVRPLEYASLRALAQAVHRLRTAGGRERGLELLPTLATFDGSDAFPAFKLLLTDENCDVGEYIAALAVKGASLEAVMAALAEANPVPARRLAA